MEKLKNTAPSILGIGVILLIGIIGLKGCIVTTWSSPDTIQTYAIEGADGRFGMVVFMPKNETMMWYTDPDQEKLEGVLVRMRGTYGTHYIGPLWRVEGPGVLIGIRWCPGGAKPVMMELETLNKHMEGPGDPYFPNVGKTNHEVLLFAGDRIKISNMWFHRVPTDEKETWQLYSLLAAAE